MYVSSDSPQISVALQVASCGFRPVKLGEADDNNISPDGIVVPSHGGYKKAHQVAIGKTG